MNTDLFPETLLVEAASGHSYTTSIMVALHFGKRHKNVLRDIDNLLEQLPESWRGRLNFEPSSYVNVQKKQQPMYRIGHDAFALLAMGFTGTEALRWKIAFLDAFKQMEAQLRSKTEREAAVLYRLRPHWQTIQSAQQRGLNRTQICHLTGHRAPASISRNRRRMREIGLMDAQRLTQG